VKEKDTPYTLDEMDLQLLDTLQRDASLSNQALAERWNLSPPTCLRRVRRLQTLGLIERTVALVQPERLAQQLGHGLQALVEITLDHQDAESLDAFEALAVAEDAVQQCWRVAPGPDFMLVLHCWDMPAYLALSQRLFSQHANVRNVKAFFATKRAKFSSLVPVLDATRK
jgi:DNA-binding Lrp family transcriptional regulator